MVLVPVSQSVGHACSGRSIDIRCSVAGEKPIRAEDALLQEGYTVGILQCPQALVDKEYETKGC